MDNKKINISLIKEILYQEISTYYKEKKNQDDLSFKLDMFGEVLKLLENQDFIDMDNQFIMIDTYLPQFYNMDGKQINEMLNKLYGAILYCKKYKSDSEKYLESEYKKQLSFINRIIRDLKILENDTKASLLLSEPQLTLEDVITFKRIISDFKFEKLITSSDYQEILKLFSRKKIPTKVQIELLEHIKNFNISIHRKENNKKILVGKKYEIINMLHNGFEELSIPRIESSTKKTIDDFINVCIKIIKDYSAGDFYELLPSFINNNFSNGYSKSDFDYFFKSLLKHYQSILQDDTEELNKFSNYEDKEIRNLLVSDYNQNLVYYKIIRNYYDLELDKYKDFIKNVDNLPDKYVIKYAVHEGNNKTFLDTDIKDIQEDYYEDLKDLLIRFKKGLLTPIETKNLYEAYPGLREIRGDQIRITYKHIKDNKYVITGVFLKKQDTDRRKYTNLNKRNSDNYIDSKDYEQVLYNYLDTNKRYGGRSKA